MTNAEIIDKIKEYMGSKAYQRIKDLTALYEADNPEILHQGAERARRGKTPNNVIPTAYYSTVVDTMAGYMGQDVQYVAEDEAQQEILDAIMDLNNAEVEDMKMVISALAYNKGVEYVYTDENSVVRFAPLSPANTIIIRGDDILHTPIEAINFQDIGKNGSEAFRVLYVTADEERRFLYDDGRFIDETIRLLPFNSLPVIDYTAQIIGNKAPFEACVPYIRALDALVSGNSNEIERLVDAILVLGKRVDETELRNMDEWKVLQDMAAEERAEYITKDTSSDFRRYVSEMLVREIHKHSHVVDWYSPDQGQSNEASGKALRTRLFDMDMYSKRIEMAYREGANARINAIRRILELQGVKLGDVEIIMKRTMIDDFLDDAVKLAQVPFLTDVTKREYLGVDEATEQERINEAGVEIVQEADARIDE